MTRDKLQDKFLAENNLSTYDFDEKYRKRLLRDKHYTEWLEDKIIEMDIE